MVCSGGKLDVGARALVKLREILFHESLFPLLAVIDLQRKKNTQGVSDLLKLFLREWHSHNITFALVSFFLAIYSRTLEIS